MDIVEKARQEQVATSGAREGSGTAAFLRADGEGDALIDSLVREETQSRARPVEAQNVSSEAAVREDVLSQLVQEQQPQARMKATPKGPAPQAPDDVDESVIDSLLGKSNDQDDLQQRGGERR